MRTDASRGDAKTAAAQCLCVKLCDGGASIFIIMMTI
jgi:hypothetical protein